MTHDAHTANVDASLEDIVRVMERHHVKRVPVVEEGTVVGIVTRANLLHALAGIADEIVPSSAGDTAIREKIFAELKRQTWAPVAVIDVTVRKGRCAVGRADRRKAAPGIANSGGEHSRCEKSEGISASGSSPRRGCTWKRDRNKNDVTQ